MDVVKIPSAENISTKPSENGNSLHNSVIKHIQCEPSVSSAFINAKIEEITGGVLEKKESDLQSRITECKSLIESLKKELHEEKKPTEPCSFKTPPSDCCPSNMGELCVDYNDLESTDSSLSANIDRKLCDDSIIAYEQQLREYQDTLNLAQAEKRNAIRREMTAKAYRLKLLELESQCGVELLRVRQGLQCLEPLRALAGQWAAAGAGDDDDSYQLMPMYTADFGTSDKYSEDTKADKEDNVVSEEKAKN